MARAATPASAERRPRPAVHWSSVAAVAGGGLVGGLARYGLLLWIPAGPRAFPWAVFAANTSGAFLLALLIVVAIEVLPPMPLLRPALGTGFCGAYTTFSSVMTSSDQLLAHGRASDAAVVLLASLFAGLAAAGAGLILGRALVLAKERGPR